MTFLITLFVLVPMGGGFRKLMLSGNGLYHHTLCPMLSEEDVEKKITQEVMH